MFRRKKKRSREFRKNSEVIDINEARASRRKKRAEAKALERMKEEERLRSEKIKADNARKKARNSGRRKIYTAIIAVIIGAIAFSVFNVASLMKEKNDLEKRQKELTETRDKLEHEVEQANSPEYIEQEARDALRLIKPGEILYILPADKTDDTQGKGGDPAEEDGQ